MDDIELIAEDEEWTSVMPKYIGYLVSNYGRVYSEQLGVILNVFVSAGEQAYVRIRCLGVDYQALVSDLVADGFPEMSRQEVNRVVEEVKKRRLAAPEPDFRPGFGLRLVDYGLEFPSHAACARFLKVSKPTISRIIAMGLDHDGVRIEEILPKQE